jgi:phage FluMu protein Com
MATGLAKTKPVTLKEVLRTTARVAVSELVASCPKCKTFETLTFTLDGTIRTRKFSQEDSQVYHDCGSTEPCRLYRVL